jgi:acetyltransferase-like isoleucine patch superfamily enzyme
MKILSQIGPQRIFKYFIFGLWDFVFRLLPYSPLRVFWLRLGGARIGKNCVIDRLTFFNLDRTGLSGLSLQNDVYLGPGVTLDLAGRIELGSQVTVSANTIILSHYSVGFDDHPLLKHYPKKVASTKIKSAAVIGVNSVIFPGVTVGQQSLVAASAVVNRSVPDHKMVAGIPAVVKKDLK